MIAKRWNIVTLALGKSFMPRRSIRAFCPRCRHQQPFVRAQFDWKLHVLLTILTCGIWLVVALSSTIKRLLWPWRCEHCGWHEPDYRSPRERREPVSRTRTRAGESGAWLRPEDGAVISRATEDLSSSGEPPAARS